MTDRPLLFSAPMVRALLDGSKTQTRRVIKLGGELPDFRGGKGDWNDPSSWGWCDKDANHIGLVKDDMGNHYWSQYQSATRIGDRIWVKETWRTWKDYDHLPPRELPDDAPILYEATIFDDLDPANCDRFGKVRQSIFLQSRFSRLTLLVTDVRVQRLQDISEADAIAEGVERVSRGLALGWRDYSDQSQMVGGPRSSYCTLWESISGPGSWEANPWVTATTFDVVKNIGEL